MLLGVLSPRSEQNREERPRQTLQEGKACRVRSVSRCWPWQSQLAAGTIAETAREEKNKISTLNRDGLGRRRVAREIWAGGWHVSGGAFKPVLPGPPPAVRPGPPCAPALCSAASALPLARTPLARPPERDLSALWGVSRPQVWRVQPGESTCMKSCILSEKV